MGVGFAVEEPDLLAVRQKRERDTQLLGVVAALVLRPDRLDPRVLRLQRRHRAARAVAEHVVRTRSVGQGVFEQDARAVGDVPVRVLQEGVDPDAGGGLGPAVHAVDDQGSSSSVPVSSKSATFRVATAMPRERAIAAIWPSASDSGRPLARRTATISA